MATAVSAVALASAASLQQPPPQQPMQTPPPPPESILKVGDRAPEFALQGSDGKVHKLSDYKGKTVVLAWFPAAFTAG